MFNAIGRGDLPIFLPNGNTRSQILLRNVLYAPSMHVTLVSISCLTEAGCHAVFDGDMCQIFDMECHPLGQVQATNSLYKTQCDYSVTAATAKGDQQLTMEDLHARLSHIGVGTIREMLAKGMITGVELDPDHSTMGQCTSCEYGKATRQPIRKVHDPSHVEKLSDEIHTNVWGPSPVQTPGKQSYYCSFTDDHTHYTRVSLMLVKSNMFQSYLEFESWLKTQHGTAVKWLRSDCGGEYLSDEFTHHLKNNGTEQKLTTHNTPEHNGVAEHLNRTLAERVCTILHASGLPKYLWGEVLLHIVWVKNRSATRALDRKTPYEMLYGKKPDLGNLPSWGVKCWVLEDTGSKLDDRAKEGHWVRFDTESTAHQIYLPDRHAVIIERNVIFQKNDVPQLVSMQLNNVTNETNPDQTNAIVKPNNAPGPTINTQPSPVPLLLAQNNPDTTVNGL